MTFIVHEARAPNQYQAPTSDQHHQAGVRSRLNYGRQLGRERSRNIGREQVIPRSNFNGSIHASGRRDAQRSDSQHEAREQSGWVQRGATSDIRASRAKPAENVATQTRALENVTFAWGTEPLVVERASKQGSGGPKVLYAPAYTPPAEEQEGFPWGALGVLIPPGLMITGIAVAAKGRRMRSSINVEVRKRGERLEKAGLSEAAAGFLLACGYSYEAIQQATKTPIVATRPADTAKPPEATKTSEAPDLSLLTPDSPFIRSLLADWNTLPVKGGMPWWHSDKPYQFETRPDGKFKVFYDKDGTKYTFATNEYFIPLDRVGPATFTAEQRTFYMMIRQTSNGSTDVTILIDPIQEKEAKLPLDTYVYHYPAGNGLVLENETTVHIEENANHELMYTVSKHGISMPLTLSFSSATTAATPAPSSSEIFNVAYLDKDPFQFGGEVSLPPEPTPTEAPVVSILTIDQMRAYTDKNFPNFVKNPDMEYKSGDAISEKVEKERKAFDAYALSWQAEKLGVSKAEISAMSVRGELLSAFNKAGITDVMLTTKQAIEFATTHGQQFSEQIEVDGTKLTFGYESDLLGPSDTGYTSLFDSMLNNPINQYTPINDLLFGQHMGKIPFRAITEADPKGLLTMRIYYAGDLKQDQKVALFAPDGRFVNMVGLSFSQHSQPMEIGTERNFQNHTLPQGLPMEQTVVWPNDNHTRWLRLTPELLSALITSEKPIYISCETNASGIQDGVPMYRVITIDPKLFETLKNDIRFKDLFVTQ